MSMEQKLDLESQTKVEARLLNETMMMVAAMLLMLVAIVSAYLWLARHDSDMRSDPVLGEYSHSTQTELPLDPPAPNRRTEGETR